MAKTINTSEGKMTNQGPIAVNSEYDIKMSGKEMMLKGKARIIEGKAMCAKGENMVKVGQQMMEKESK